jgi:hypothetical protein
MMDLAIAATLVRELTEEQFDASPRRRPRPPETRPLESRTEDRRARMRRPRGLRRFARVVS